MQFSLGFFDDSKKKWAAGARYWNSGGNKVHRRFVWRTGFNTGILNIATPHKLENVSIKFNIKEPLSKV